MPSRRLLAIAVSIALSACTSVPEAITVDFTQAVDGALWANPSVHPTLPLRVHSDVPLDELLIAVDRGQAIAAEQTGEDGVWTASLSVEDLGLGPHDVVAIATGSAGEEGTAQIELVLGTEGIQLTDYDVVGPGLTPQVHYDGSALHLTWCDRSEAGTSQCWLRRVDGAGRWTGEAVRLSPPGEDVLYARTAIADDRIGVLYQRPGGMPYQNALRITDLTGAEVIAEIPLDASPLLGTFGGDIAWDGEAFVAVWRMSDGAGAAEVRWIRVDPATSTVTGPITVASAGEQTDDGAFPLFSFVEIAPAGEVSVVSFTRDRYVSVLAMEVPKAQMAVVDRSGVVSTAFLTGAGGLDWDWETHVDSLGDDAVVLWTTDDLDSIEEPTPTEIQAARFAAPDGARSGPTSSLHQAADTRGEPALVDRGSRPPAVAWIDHRAYSLDPSNGRIELYVAPLESGLAAGEPMVYPHARFFAGLTDLGGVAVDDTVVWTWRDQRHSVGMESHAEVWLEVSWFE